MYNILVMGGAGYIGSHTVKHLQQHGYNCIVADNLVYGHREAVLTPNFELADLADKSSLNRVFEKYNIDAVVHFAAFTYVGESVENPRKYYENNVVGTLNLLDVMLSHNVKKIVFSSTCATYGNPLYMPLDEKHSQNPINAYGRTKFFIEQIFNDYERAYGLRHIALRYFNAAGCSPDGEIGESHNPETHLIPLVLKAIKGERPAIKVFGTDYDTPDGTGVRDYIHVVDLAKGHVGALRLCESSAGATAVNLGTGTGYSVLDIVHAFERANGIPIPYVVDPHRPGDVAVSLSDPHKAKQLFGWTAEKTLEDMCRDGWRFAQLAMKD